MYPRTHLIKIQKKLTNQLKKKSERLKGTLSGTFRKYTEEYEKDLINFSALSHAEELKKAVLDSQIVLIGDFHSLNQAQKTVLNLLKEAKKENPKILLALEMIEFKHNKSVEKYLKGQLDEKTLLKKIQFKKWGFPWEGYQPIFDFCKKHEIPIIGINPPENHKRLSLKQRDLFFSKMLSQLSADNPKTILFSLIGDFHLASLHVPKLLKQELKNKKIKRKFLIIHQNYEPLYWKLVETGAESWADIVRLKKNVYCILNTQPWIKLKKDQVWNEYVQNNSIEATDEIQTILSLLTEFFKIKTAPKEFQDFEIYSNKKSLFRVRRNYSQKEWQALLRQIHIAGYAFCPKPSILYCEDYNFNHWAEIAGKYLHHKLSGFSLINLYPNKVDERIVLQEALGFLSSKIMNPKRKTSTQKKLEINSILGRQLGEKLYQALLLNQISDLEIKKIFFTNFIKKNHAKKIILSIESQIKIP